MSVIMVGKSCSSSLRLEVKLRLVSAIMVGIRCSSSLGLERCVRK